MNYFRWRSGILNRALSQYVGQLELANMPIEGWVIDTDVHSLLAGSCNVVHLPTHKAEVFHPGMMI